MASLFEMAATECARRLKAGDAEVARLVDPILLQLRQTPNPDMALALVRDLWALEESVPAGSVRPAVAQIMSFVVAMRDQHRPDPRAWLPALIEAGLLDAHVRHGALDVEPLPGDSHAEILARLESAVLAVLSSGRRVSSDIERGKQHLVAWQIFAQRRVVDVSPRRFMAPHALRALATLLDQLWVGAAAAPTGTTAGYCAWGNAVAHAWAAELNRPLDALMFQARACQMLQQMHADGATFDHMSRLVLTTPLMQEQWTDGSTTVQRWLGDHSLGPTRWDSKSTTLSYLSHLAQPLLAGEHPPLLVEQQLIAAAATGDHSVAAELARIADHFGAAHGIASPPLTVARGMRSVYRAT